MILQKCALCACAVAPAKKLDGSRRARGTVIARKIEKKNKAKKGGGVVFRAVVGGMFFRRARYSVGKTLRLTSGCVGSIKRKGGNGEGVDPSSPWGLRLPFAFGPGFQN